MFKITEGDFKKQVYEDERYLTNWPMLYILENGKQRKRSWSGENGSWICLGLD